MATHSSILAHKIPPTEEPGWLQSKGSQSRAQPSTAWSTQGAGVGFMTYKPASEKTTSKAPGF